MTKYYTEHNEYIQVYTYFVFQVISPTKLLTFAELDVWMPTDRDLTPWSLLSLLVAESCLVLSEGKEEGLGRGTSPRSPIL